MTSVAVPFPATRIALTDVSAESLDRARSMLTVLGGRSPVLAAIAAHRSADVELDDTDDATIDQLLIASRSMVRPDGFPQRFDRCDRIEAAALLEHAIEFMADADVAAVDILIRRARDPYEALITYPPEQLLDPGVAATVRATSLDLAPVDRGQGKVEFGADVDYAGMTTVIFKMTRLCNLRCTYCNDWSADSATTMSQATRLLGFRRLLRERGVHAANIVWHGGEPTTIGRRELLATLWIQRWAARPGLALSNVLQTNATRLDDDWGEFFARYGFVVGVSLDGPKEVHDRTRPGLGGRPSFDRALHGIGVLQRHGVFRGALMVVTSEIAAMGGRGIVDFFRSVGIDRCALLPVRPQVGEAAPYMTIADWTRLLVDVDIARRDGGPALAVRELDAIERTVRGEVAAWCELQGNCVGSVLNLEADGSIGHCDKYVGDARFKVGDLGAASVIDDARLRAIRHDDSEQLDSVRDCAWFEACRGWCPHEREVQRASGRTVDRNCCGLSPVYDHLANVVSSVDNVGGTVQ